jgi:hypothetical protein
MGMDQKVIFPTEKTPTWPALQSFFAAKDVALQLRMIDGELAFPDETPPDAWRELRIGTSSGMITLRRDPDGITLVTWGNADQAMRQAWNALTWGIAHLSGGSVNGTMSADEFAKTADMPTALMS